MILIKEKIKNNWYEKNKKEKYSLLVIMMEKKHDNDHSRYLMEKWPIPSKKKRDRERES